MKTRQIVREALRVHKVEDGDFLVFDSNIGMKIQDLRNMGEYLNRSGRGNCILVLAEKVDGVHVFDEAEMNRLGWYRREEDDAILGDA